MQKANGEKLSSYQEEIRPAVKMEVGACQSVGKRYSHNEDSVFVLSSLLSSDKTYFPFGLFIICDGMGGHENGEEASALAITAMSDHILRTLYLPMMNPAGLKQPEPVQEVIETGLHMVNKLLVEKVPEGGTTMTTVVIMGDYMTLGHVGDSRAYLITGDQTMEQISLDQTLAQRLVDLGQLTPEEGKLYPRKNILYSALGQSDTLDTLIITRKTPETGYIFICSDGVTSCIDDDTIHAVIRNEKTPQSACDKLVGLANEAGGPDNISAILVKLVA